METTVPAGDATASDEPAAATGEGVCAGDVTDLLKEICDKGTLTVSTDPAYPPQSSLNEQTGEYEGFDIDVATEIAKRLGVDVAWEAPSWDVITAGSWNGRWDTTVGSMTPTNDRQEVLYFTQPYNYTPAVVVVGADNTDVSDLSTDLDGKKIGVCAGCTYEQFLEQGARHRGLRVRLHHRRRRGLRLRHRHHGAAGPRSTAASTPSSPRSPPPRATSTPATRCRSSATRCSTSRSPSGFDKSSDPSSESLYEAVDGIVAEMHEDGTLTAMSEQWYGLDLTTQQ